MADKIDLKVVTPERVVYEDVVDGVSVMTANGEVTVLPGHIPLISNLVPGEARVTKRGKSHVLAVSTGFLQVRSGEEVVILADTADRLEELEPQSIEEAKERARKLMEEARDEDDVAFARASAQLERELARERVMRRHRHQAHQRSTAPETET